MSTAENPYRDAPRVLITGCSGFIGRNITRTARARGWVTGGISRLQPAGGDAPDSFYPADIARDDLFQAFEDFAPSTVIHAAGSSSVAQSFNNPLMDFRQSVETWAHVLDAVRTTNANPVVVFLSSAAVYGKVTELPIAESHSRRPLSPYGLHKLMCETLGQGCSTMFGIRMLVCRLFSLVGPDQRRLLPWELFRQFTDPSVEEVVLEGSPDSSRDYLHIDDAASGILDLAAADHPLQDAPLFVNVASGAEVSVREVARVIGQDLVSSKPIVFRGIDRPGDPKRWRADTTVISKLLPNWSPRHFEQAAKECVSRWAEE